MLLIGFTKLELIKLFITPGRGLLNWFCGFTNLGIDIIGFGFGFVIKGVVV